MLKKIHKYIAERHTMHIRKFEGKKRNVCKCVVFINAAVEKTPFTT